MSELYGHFFTNMMASIEAECRQYDKHIVVTASHKEEEREKEDIAFLIGRNCDALILHVEAVSDEYLIDLCKGSIPVVIINRYIEKVADHCIYLDNVRGGYLATHYLLSKGHTNFAYIAGPSHKKDAMERVIGHKMALEEHGIAFDKKRFFEGDYLQTGGARAFEYFNSSNIPVSAFLCANDEMATGVMAAAREHNLDIPSDISVFGFDNVVFSRYTYPTLSTINNPINEMGAMAARHVLQRVYKKKVGMLKNQFLPEVIERNSVRQI